MKKRLFVAVVMATGLGLSLPTVLASADDQTPVTIDCGDGSPIQATVDTPTLTSLEASIQAIADNPAGLSCALTTGSLPTLSAPAVGTSPSSGSGHAFVVGGGRYARSGGCGINFNISAHLDSNNVVHGTVAFSLNNAPGCSQGSVRASVTCLNPLGNTAEVKGDVTHATGVLAGFQTTPPTVIFTDVQDNGTPSSGMADAITQDTDVSSADMVCSAAPGSTPIDNGNITVHD